MSISQGRATTQAPVSSRYPTPEVASSGRNPRAARASALLARGTASPPKGTGRVFAHGIAIGRLVDVKYTAASAGSPCTKIAAVAHVQLLQSFPCLP